MCSQVDAIDDKSMLIIKVYCNGVKSFSLKYDKVLMITVHSFFYGSKTAASILFHLYRLLIQEYSAPIKC